MKKISIIVISVICFTLLAAFINSRSGYRGPLKNYFGIKYEVEQVILSFNTKRDIFNDGFAIELVKIDQESMDYFQNLPIEFFDEFPKRHYYLRDYDIYNWRQTPIDVSLSLQTQVATWQDEEYKSSWKTRKVDQSLINKYLSYTDSLLQTEGNYYALLFRGDESRVFGIDLLLVTPKDGVVVKINRQ